MERSVTPWRVIEDADGSGGALAPAGAPVDAGARRWSAWPVLGGLVIAGALGVAAVALVASGPAPVATVQTDTDPVAAGIGSGPASGPAAAATPADRVVVHVAGAVRKPGLVTLPAGSRVADAIEAAGGLGPRVDAARVGTDLNLAALVADGERVIVPSRDDPGAGAPADGGSGGAAGGTGSGLEGAGPVDLNHATAAALEALPGIGEVTAAKIIAARQERPFRSVDELLERKVVGAATLAKFRDLVVVR